MCTYVTLACNVCMHVWVPNRYKQTWPTDSLINDIVTHSKGKYYKIIRHTCERQCEPWTKAHMYVCICQTLALHRQSTDLYGHYRQYWQWRRRWRPIAITTDNQSVVIALKPVFINVRLKATRVAVIKFGGIRERLCEKDAVKYWSECEEERSGKRIWSHNKYVSVRTHVLGCMYLKAVLLKESVENKIHFLLYHCIGWSI